MNAYNRGGLFGSLPQVTRSLLIINIVVFVITALLQRTTVLPYYLRLYNFESDLFRPYQLVTHMFMHGDIFHIFVNMFGLFMFGRVLENVWGSRKFFLLYMLTLLSNPLHMQFDYLILNQQHRFYHYSNLINTQL